MVGVCRVSELLFWTLLLHLVPSWVAAFTATMDPHQSEPRTRLLMARTTKGNIERKEATVDCPSRRQAMMQVILLAAGALATTGDATAHAAAGTMEKVTQLTPDQAEKRLRAGRESIQYLLDHYDEIAAGGGDNVRRYLGTVGFTSGLVQIDKTMKALADRADDFVEYTETQNEVVQSIQQADGSAYMAIFVTTSPSETPPSKYFDDAKIEVKNCIKAMDHLATLIDLQY